MNVMNDIEQEGENIMNDPNKRAKIEQIAKEKGITLEQAKEHFMKQNGQTK